MKNLFNKYSAFLLKIPAPLGAWGVFAIAAIDSAAFGLPLDVVVAGYIYQRPSWLLIYAALAAAGSAVGSLVIYFIGLRGEEMLLEKRISKQKIESIRDRFERQEFLALMIPAMLPPPTPFKLIVLSAGAFRMHVRDFLLAIFSGRMVRFVILGLLVRYLGPGAVHTIAALFREHLLISLAVLAAVLALLFFLWRKPAKEISRELHS